MARLDRATQQARVLRDAQLPHPEEARSAVSKDGKCAPQHEARADRILDRLDGPLLRAMTIMLSETALGFRPAGAPRRKLGRVAPCVCKYRAPLPRRTIRDGRDRAYGRLRMQRGSPVSGPARRCRRRAW